MFEVLGMKSLIVFLLLLTFFCGMSYSQPPIKIVGYWPSWQSDFSSLNFNQITNLFYAFALPGSDGGIRSIPDTALLTQLVSQAHKHHVKISMAFGGWSNRDEGFKALVMDESLRRKFTDQVLKCIETYALDGVDLDWEYPDNSSKIRGFTQLVRELGTRLKKRGKLLTVAVTQDDFPKSIRPEMIPYFDFFNIMAYDNNGPQHSTLQHAREALDYWSGFGLKKEQIVIGVPFYARGTVKNATISYKTIISMHPDASDKDSVTIEGVTYNYNGIQTIQEKALLALKRAGGVMIWELSQDSAGQKSLLSAIYNVTTSSTTQR
jgi:chitinase